MKFKFGFLILLLVPITTFAEDLHGSADSEILKRRASSLELTLPTEHGPVEFKLTKRDIRSPKYFSQTTGKKNKRSKVTVDLYRSDLGGGKFARLAVLRTNNGSPELHGVFNDGESLYGVSPAEQAANDGTTRVRAARFGTEYVVSKLKSSEELVCSEDSELHKRSAAMKARAGLTGAGTIELATEADYEYVRQAGGADKANALILSIINGVDGIYRSELNLGIQVTYQHAWTDPASPLNSKSISASLKNFMKLWNGAFKGRVVYDIAHYFKGTSRGKGTVGLAYRGAVCQLYNYGVSERTGGGVSFYVPLVAHEIGHNLGAVHDQDKNFIMYPVLSSNLNKFAAVNKSQISDNLSQVGDCLGSGGQVTQAPRQLSVTKLRASKGNSKTYAKISWAKVPGASAYQVFRSTSSGVKGSYLGQSVKNSYVDKSGTSGTHYFYTVVVIVGPDEGPATQQIEGWKK